MMKKPRHDNDPFNIYISSHQYEYMAKIIAMVMFIFFDLTLNSVTEFQNFKNSLTPVEMTTSSQGDSSSDDDRDEVRRTQLMLCGLQMLGQLSIFAILFLLLCDTFPFQVGLLGVLMRRFKTILWLHFGYFTMTILISALRMSKLDLGWTFVDVWDWNFYTVCSFLQKLVAPFYYSENFKSIIELGSPKYLTKENWVTSRSKPEEILS